MSYITPRQASEIQRRFGLDFVSARRSPLVRQLIATEARVRELETYVRRTHAHTRAWHRVRALTPRAKVEQRHDMRVRLDVLTAQLARARQARDRERRRALALRAKIIGRYADNNGGHK